MKKVLAIIGLLFLMVACSSTEEVKSSGKGKSYSSSTNQTVRKIGKFQVDSSSYVAIGKNERVQFIILHYTATDNLGSIKELTSSRVSAHFLVLDEDDNKIYSLVPLEQRAWHAGASAFRGRTNINDTSVGIEIVSDGIAREYRDNDPDTYHPYDHYVDYKPIQIEKAAQIVKYVAEKYKIPAKNILAHSDIAPSRKKDPGAKFPWKELYDKYNIGAWYDEADKQEFMDEEKYNATSIREIKDELRKYGYEINRFD